ncbi:hypothetical protein JR316_0003937 [Psilocybe cubensis]|uniref:Uncharacterized protein n=2 Tax=Psilocybe cubensis TaxID=181762 RepID=A0ACB8H9Q0_PSICU|nr:hypothetical protein JR316_0003937 [Psilocybe cubensis]KAH9484455.1 hypothetical protein JR316_0003937 [Psilocybe cubensis]
MSALYRLLYLPASRRSYSSYFSSKSGGGRYFNSAKSPKNAVVPAKNNTKTDSPAEVTQDSVQSTATRPNAVVSSSIAESKSSPTNASTSTSAPSTSENTTNAASQPSDLANAFSEFTNNHIPQVSISSKDFKMHQFFSLHRPLLLISQPTSIFRQVPANYPLFSALQPEVEHPPAPKYGLGTTKDLFIDPDAEAARQLTRALTLSKAGATLAWEKTMKHLGLDVSKDADRINLQQQFDKEWEEVLLDSTKRKRRKKMKKHKLRKRRRATRAERLRLK